MFVILIFKGDKISFNGINVPLVRPKESLLFVEKFFQTKTTQTGPWFCLGLIKLMK